LGRFVAKPVADPVSKEKGLIQDALKIERCKGPDTKKGRQRNCIAALNLGRRRNQSSIGTIDSFFSVSLMS